MAKIAVIGIGNVLMADDGVGVEAVNRLADMSWPENVTIFDAGTSIMQLLDVFKSNNIVIVIDALCGGHEPGAIYRLTAKELGYEQSVGMSLHDVQVLDILNIAAFFHKPPEVIIYGIEPYILTLNYGLSPAMQKQLPVLVEQVKQEIKQYVCEAAV